MNIQQLKDFVKNAGSKIKNGDLTPIYLLQNIGQLPKQVLQMLADPISVISLLLFGLFQAIKNNKDKFFFQRQDGNKDGNYGLQIGQDNDLIARYLGMLTPQFSGLPLDQKESMLRAIPEAQKQMLANHKVRMSFLNNHENFPGEMLLDSWMLNKDNLPDSINNEKNAAKWFAKNSALKVMKMYEQDADGNVLTRIIRDAARNQIGGGERVYDDAGRRILDPATNNPLVPGYKGDDGHIVVKVASQDEVDSWRNIANYVTNPANPLFKAAYQNVILTQYNTTIQNPFRREAAQESARVLRTI